MTITIIVTEAITDNIALAFTHSECMVVGDEVMEILKREDAAVLQHIGNIQQIDIIIPFANAVGPVIHIIDKIDMQGVPFSVFPITHATLAMGSRRKIVFTFGYMRYQLTVLIKDMAVMGQHQHCALVNRLNGVDWLMVLTRR